MATISNAGNAQFNGTLQVGGTAQSAGTLTVRNNADAEVDYYLWPGLTASQKGSFTYKDWNGNSQWYMVKDASNNWALNSAVGGLDSFKAYQSTNSGDTYIDASNSTGHIRLNYETARARRRTFIRGRAPALWLHSRVQRASSFRDWPPRKRGQLPADRQLGIYHEYRLGVRIGWRRWRQRDGELGNDEPGCRLLIAWHCRGRKQFDQSAGNG